MTVDNSAGSSALPRPADDEVTLLLQTVWDLLADGEHWPTYRTVDRLLYRERRIDVDAVIARTSPQMLLGGRPQGDAPPPPDGQLSLTAAGAAVCLRSGPALEVFLAAVRLAAEAELRLAPDGEEPSVTFDEAATAVPLSTEDSARVARQSGLLLHAEPWTGYVLLYQGGWRLTVDRRARPYAGVVDLEGYWAVQERQQQRPVGEPRPPQGAGAGGRVIELAKRWEIGEQLGSGGFGKVFSATGEDGTSAAAKFVPQMPGADREMLFVRLDGVGNVVPILDVGEVDDAWVLVMPRAERSLQEQLDSVGKLPVDQVLTVLRDVATALADLAARGAPVVHRDIKPANVLLLDDAWRLADFGISRYAEASTAPDTHKYAMSAPYAAPERWRAERATAAADVYAVGAMAHELLSGRRPFPGPTWEDYREQHMHDDPPRLSDAPPRLAALVEECLYKPPQARPSPANLAARLDRADETGLSPGASALSAAYQQQAERLAAQGVSASRDQSEQQRREALGEAAGRALAAVSTELMGVILAAAPGTNVRRGQGAEWTAQLGPARFQLSAALAFDGRAWGGWQGPPFDVIAFATISVIIPADQHGYEGRSHSLYYCDAKQQGAYAWYETAFMINPLLSQRVSQNPFALVPGEAAAKALWTGMAGYQVAWPFTELVLGDLSEFVDRWVGWFATAVQGRLTHPHTTPERPPEGSWRRR